MKLAKTAAGREALSRRDERLGIKLRQLMVMANGERDLPQLLQVSGTSLKDIESLMAWGFLVDSKGREPVGNGGSQQKPRAAIQESLTSTPAKAAGSHRRSLAAAKLYMLGILDVLRHPTAADMKASLHACSDAQDLVRSLKHCIVSLRQHASDGYASRVVSQLIELLPAEHAMELGLNELATPSDA